MPRKVAGGQVDHDIHACLQCAGGNRNEVPDRVAVQVAVDRRLRWPRQPTGSKHMGYCLATRLHGR